LAIDSATTGDDSCIFKKLPMKTLGIDIGGSALKGAIVDTTNGKLLAERFRIETPDNLTPRDMAGAVKAMAEHFKWKGPIGVGFPGVIEDATIWTSANLDKKFIGCDGAKLFGKATGCPITMINDAAAAGVAEMHFGVGAGFMGKALLLTLGTGVGSCFAYQGVVTPMELGHFPWGKHGKSAEKFIAASVLEEKKLSWKEWGGRLQEYVAILEKLLWPELIIIGGGVSADHAKFFKYIKPRAKLVPAEFLNNAGIVGAALWAAKKR
jgi:polyphosphate glucokinase